MSIILTKKNIAAIIIIGVIFSIFGFSFEYTYFKRIGFNVNDHLSYKHFIISGAQTIIPMFVLLIIFNNAKRFFSKDIYVDPNTKLNESLKKASFQNIINSARVDFGISILFALTIFLLPKIGIQWDLWTGFLYIVLMISQSFIFAMITSPSHARAPIILMFVVSISICFASGGYGYAGTSRTKDDGSIRDDMVVKILRQEDGGYQVNAKEIDFPFSIAGVFEKIVDKLENNQSNK